MPEGPEVRYFAQTLDRLFSGFILTKIDILQGPYVGSEKPKYQQFRDDVSSFTGARVNSVIAHGKVMFFMFETNPKCQPVSQYHSLMVHHGMEGSWTRSDQNKHRILRLEMTHRSGDSDDVFFQDSRRFGTFKFLSAGDHAAEIEKLGPNVFDVELDQFISIFLSPSLRKKYQKWFLCDVLMEQNVLSGIGNYLRADILYDAKIDPKSMFAKLELPHIVQLYFSMNRVLIESWECRATTVNGATYEDSIHTGKYECLCYGRKTCEYGHPVETFESKKRTVHFSPMIQTWSI